MSNTSHAPRVTVLEIRTVDAGNLKAFVKLKIGPLEICDFRLIQQANQKAYVSPPQIQWEKHGKRYFKPVVSYPDTWVDAIEEAILTEWAKRGDSQWT